MKKIYYLLAAGVLAFAASCQKPQFVEPTADRQGITSLTAYFTSGKYVEKEMGKLVVPEGESPDRYVIPIPWFYPEESNDVTTLHMSKVRVRAELAENCKIDPPLTILDLNQEHHSHIRMRRERASLSSLPVKESSLRLRICLHSTSLPLTAM